MEPSDTFCVRKNLDEVSFIRPILILLVVIYHAMAIHTGNWELPDGCTVIPLYKVIGRLSYAFMLEAFVFISGYVWAFQRETRGRRDGFGVLCYKKFLRLLIPSIIFGLFYLLLFDRGNFSISSLLEGPGHLWFLPMLFECFLFSWCILYTKVSFRYILPILFLIGIFVPAGLPLRLSYTMYYMPFFLGGYYLYGCYERLTIVNIYHILGVWVLFFIVYFGMVAFRSWLIPNVHQPMLLGGGKLGSMAVYAMIGVFALLITSIWLTNRIQLSAKYIKLGNLCMGVYIFQQFILEIFYYHSPMPSMLSNLQLPLVGFVIALVVSLVLTYTLRTTKLGKKLL